MSGSRAVLELSRDLVLELSLSGCGLGATLVLEMHHAAALSISCCFSSRDSFRAVRAALLYAFLALVSVSGDVRATSLRLFGIGNKTEVVTKRKL